MSQYSTDDAKKILARYSARSSSKNGGLTVEEKRVRRDAAKDLLTKLAELATEAEWEIRLEPDEPGSGTLSATAIVGSRVAIRIDYDVETWTLFRMNYGRVVNGAHASFGLEFDPTTNTFEERIEDVLCNERRPAIAVLVEELCSFADRIENPPIAP